MLHLLIFVLYVSLVVCQNTVTVDTSIGKITGLQQFKVIGPQNYTYNEFRRIPFAKPPVGDLRFQKPVAFGSWNQTLNATYFGSACIQGQPSEIVSGFIPNNTISEDCLFLNIYVPTSKSSSAAKKAVMIWIHGGSYISGTGMLYNGAYMASVGDVIIVTVNYRLGVFGFLSTGNENAVGNYGLWDQKMAIEWVKDNIEAFGGDTSNITIFGESAGGFSVSLHSLIPQNKGLFNRVIAQSGVSTSFVATEYNITYYTNRIINVLKCTSPQQSVEIKCLKNKSAADVQTAYNYLYSLPITDPHDFLVFAPRVDRDLLMDHPKILLKNRSSEAYMFFRSLDMIVGNVNSEGSLLLGNPLTRLQKAYRFNIDLGIPRSILCDHLATTMALDDYNNNAKIAPAVCQKYGYSLGLYRSMNSVYYYGDIYFYSKTVETLNFHSEGTPSSKTFQYLSTKRTILSKRVPLWFEGASHASEIPLLFPFYNFLSNTSEDLTLSLTVMKYWTNFAKYGDPNDEILPSWSPYTQSNKAYQILDVTISSDKDMYKDRVDFWLIDIPKLINSTADESTNNSNRKSVTQMHQAYHSLTGQLLIKNEYPKTKMPLHKKNIR
ncbi:fatty acyl-CoA hydrolase precursor, medium chain-like [Mytilus galloprovincialis]|uniref:fatty acyl-CoA hydrolase precursor, medium chain-like n=1 Tax=Mytilus galloprovincialis TaxID=29158 RepID=UPI003F7B45A9